MKAKNDTQQPLVSVVMPVHNAQSFVSQAIQSIVAQTFKNFEFLILDDYSTDDSLKIIKKWAKKDARIRIIRNTKAKGVSSAANQLHKAARGTFIARMDADDIAEPTRLQKQLAIFKKYPKTIVVGSQCTVIDENNLKTGAKTFPTQPEDIKKMSGYLYPVQQPSVMFNTSLIPSDFAWYDESLNSAEEHELLFKLMQFGEVRNTKESLLQYRIHTSNTSKKHPKRDYFAILRARIVGFTKYGVPITAKAVVLNAIQFLIVSLVPEKILFSLFSLIRGMNRKESFYEK